MTSSIRTRNQLRVQELSSIDEVIEESNNSAPYGRLRKRDLKQQGKSPQSCGMLPTMKSGQSSRKQQPEVPAKALKVTKRRKPSGYPNCDGSFDDSQEPTHAMPEVPHTAFGGSPLFQKGGRSKMHGTSPDKAPAVYNDGRARASKRSR
jgi:hypothetical protein